MKKPKTKPTPAQVAEDRDKMLYFCAANAARRDRNLARFYTTFEVLLNRFWKGNILGFDIIAFDDWIKPMAHESTADAVKRRFGKRGLVIIQDLLGKEWKPTRGNPKQVTEGRTELPQSIAAPVDEPTEDEDTGGD